MTQARLFTLHCSLAGGCMVLFALVLVRVLQPRFDIPQLTFTQALLLFPLVAAAVAGLTAGKLDRSLFGPLRGMALALVVFVALALLESGIWFFGAVLEHKLPARIEYLLSSVAIVFAFGGLLYGWIVLVLGCVFGAIYRIRTVNRARAGVGNESLVDETANREPGPRGPIAELSPESASGESNAAGPGAVPARWRARVDRLYPIMLLAAAALGALLGSLVGAGKPAESLAFVVWYLLFPAYAVADTLANPRLAVSALRTGALPLAHGAAASVALGSEAPMLGFVLVAAFTAGASFALVAIILWQRSYGADGAGH